jgi:hypothetical protein
MWWAILMATLAAVLSPYSDGGDFDALRGKRVLGAALASSAMEHSAGEDVSTPRTPENLLLMFLISPRYNAYLWKHPETMPNLMDRMTEPGFMLATYRATMQPEACLHFLQGWTDLEKMRSYFEMLDPKVILAWAGAAADPASYRAMFERLSDPGKLRNWMTFAMGSRVQEILEPLLSPQTYVLWLTLPFSPATATQLQGPMRMLNPAQPLIMASTMLDSGMQAMQRFISPASPISDP